MPCPAADTRICSLVVTATATVCGGRYGDWTAAFPGQAFVTSEGSQRGASCGVLAAGVVATVASDPECNFTTLDCSQLLTTGYLAFANTFLFPEHERCVLASCPSMRLRTCSVVGTYLTLTSCGCFDRDEANPPTRFLSSGEVSDLVRLMTGSDANYLRIVPFDVAQRTVVEDMLAVSRGEPAVRRLLIVNDGLSGTRGNHWFTHAYEVRPRAGAGADVTSPIQMDASGGFNLAPNMAGGSLDLSVPAALKSDLSKLRTNVQVVVDACVALERAASINASLAAPFVSTAVVATTAASAVVSSAVNAMEAAVANAKLPDEDPDELAREMDAIEAMLNAEAKKAEEKEARLQKAAQKKRELLEAKKAADKVAADKAAAVRVAEKKPVPPPSSSQNKPLPPPPLAQPTVATNTASLPPSPFAQWSMVVKHGTPPRPVQQAEATTASQEAAKMAQKRARKERRIASKERKAAETAAALADVAASMERANAERVAAEKAAAEKAAAEKAAADKAAADKAAADKAAAKKVAAQKAKAAKKAAAKKAAAEKVAADKVAAEEAAAEKAAAVKAAAEKAATEMDTGFSEPSTDGSDAGSSLADFIADSDLGSTTEPESERVASPPPAKPKRKRRQPHSSRRSAAKRRRIASSSDDSSGDDDLMASAQAKRAAETATREAMVASAQKASALSSTLTAEKAAADMAAADMAAADKAAADKTAADKAAADKADVAVGGAAAVGVASGTSVGTDALTYDSIPTVPPGSTSRKATLHNFFGKSAAAGQTTTLQFGGAPPFSESEIRKAVAHISPSRASACWC
jgi:hypothetical protein